MTSRTADGVEGEAVEFRGTVSHSLRGGSRFAGRGRSSTFHSSRDFPHPDPVKNLNVQNLDADPTVNLSLANIEPAKDKALTITPSSSLVSQATDSSVPPCQIVASTSLRNTPPPILTNQIVPFRSPRETNLPTTHSRPISKPDSPPPVLKSSVPLVSPNINPSDISHGSVVSLVSSALDSSEMEEDSASDEGSTDAEDDEMPDDEIEPDDSMTLVQYQAGVRRETLIRKGVHADEVSPKKGRIETGSSGV